MYIKRGVTLIALALNFFVYFYPDLVNENRHCRWDFELFESKYPFLNGCEPWKQYLLGNFPSLQAPRRSNPEEVRLLAFGDPQINGNWKSTLLIKRLDNFGNDYYLGHIYETMTRRLRPTHVAVMGDQFSLQWILDLEFYNRTRRFVERIFTRELLEKQTVLDTFREHKDYDWGSWMEEQLKMDPQERFKSQVYEDVYNWAGHSPLFINLTGNHDVGYSGDATWQHMARFNHLFGKENYVIYYNRGLESEWRLVVLNSLALEGPALQEEFVNYTWAFLNGLQSHNAEFTGSTVLFTHIPFYKPAGLCADGPEHIYYENYDKEPYKNGKLRSQNQLLYETLQKVLNILFHNNKLGTVLTGHDHVGCDTIYDNVNGEWVANWPHRGKRNVREIVVRSMMGDFDGQTGILTGRYDGDDSKEWLFSFHYCLFVVQHWWWALKVAALVALLLHSLSLLGLVDV